MRILTSLITYVILLTSYGQNKEMPGVLVYFGDQFIFYPNQKLSKNPKKTFKALYKTEGILIKPLKVSAYYSICDYFKTFDVDTSLIVNDSWKRIHLSECSLLIDQNSLICDSKKQIRLGFTYKSQYYELSGNKFYMGSFASGGRKLENSDCKEELRVTPPGTLIHIE